MHNAKHLCSPLIGSIRSPDCLSLGMGIKTLYLRPNTRVIRHKIRPNIVFGLNYADTQYIYLYFYFY